MSIQDHIVLIIGASSGIGAAIARICSSGCKTDFGGSTARAVRAARDELSNISAIHLLPLDVCDRAPVESAITSRHLGHL